MTQRPMGSDWDYADEPEPNVTSQQSQAEQTVRDAMAPPSSSGQMATYEPKATSNPAPPMDDAIREAAAKRVKDRVAFKASLNSFLGVNLLLWVIWLVSSINHPDNFRHVPWPIWVTVFWGLGVFGHWRRIRNPDPTPAELEAQIETEARRLRGE